MDTSLHEGQTWESIDYSGKELVYQEFTGCAFSNCIFLNSNLGNSDFTDCSFTNCNFSLAQLNNTGLKNITFTDCKLMGTNFNVCSDFLFSVTFERCILDYSSFYRKKMKKTRFANCSLKEVDFAEVDLSMAVFDNCDLFNAVFVQTTLEKADFRTAYNYTFDPEINKVKKARFSHAGVIGLLSKYNIEIE